MVSSGHTSGRVLGNFLESTGRNRLEGEKEREREHINPLAIAFIALSICPFQSIFLILAAKVLSAHGSYPLSNLT